jgi:carbamoyltransferase
MNERSYIGLACSLHDPALAIVDASGELRFAEAAERALQTKRAYNSPPAELSRAAELLEHRSTPDSDLVLASTWSHRYTRTMAGAWCAIELYDGARRLLSRRSANGSAVASMAGYQAHFERFAHWLCASQVAANSVASSNIAVAVQSRRVKRLFDRPTRRTSTVAPPQPVLDSGRRIYLADFDHHLTHAAAACFSSPYDEAVCAVIDGYGEGFSSSRFFHFRNGLLTRIPSGTDRGTVSLGLYYFWLCIACGFEAAKGEEWKVMGLAPYGRRDEHLYRNLKDRIAVDRLRIVRGRNRETLQEALESLMHAGRGAPAKPVPPDIRPLVDCDPADLALAGQRVFEETVVELLSNLHRCGLSQNLVLTGGCALNSSCNGKLLDLTPFESLYVYCAPGDDGNAVGAALLAWQADHPAQRPPLTAATPYLGSDISERTLERMIGLGRLPGGRLCASSDEAARCAAELLAEGKIVGWMQGRAEFGPRALGNRSILADPRAATMKDRLNERVKFREEFRPFAPSILHEHGPEYFEHYQESPYMERTLRFRAEAAARVPAVVHVDGTGRLQTVKREWNPRFYELIRSFHQLTGVPIVLNTSFNVMGKPIIHSVEDAIAEYYTSGLDALVIGDVVVEKDPGAADHVAWRGAGVT